MTAPAVFLPCNKTTSPGNGPLIVPFSTSHCPDMLIICIRPCGTGSLQSNRDALCVWTGTGCMKGCPFTGPTLDCTMTLQLVWLVCEGVLEYDLLLTSDLLSLAGGTIIRSIGVSCHGMLFRLYELDNAHPQKCAYESSRPAWHMLHTVKMSELPSHGRLALCTKSKTWGI